MIRKLLPLALLSLLLPLGAARAETADVPKVHELDRIVAVVNEGVITNSELQKRIRQVVSQLQQNNTPLPSQKVLEKQVLERMILQRIELQKARDHGIRVDDETVNRVLHNIAANNKMSLQQFRKVLASKGYDFAQFRDNIRHEIMTTRLRHQEVDNKVSVTQQEIDNLLKTQQKQSYLSDEYHLSHILIAVPEAASPQQVQAAKAKAQMVLKKLRGGADFREMAVSYSDGQQALKGGDLGWRKGGQLPSAFVQLIAKLPVGGISDLIRTPNGFHIIKLDERRGEGRHVVKQVHARHILIKTNELVTDAQAKARLERLRSRIENGADFAKLARANSEDEGSAAKGGDLGWSDPGQFVPRFAQVLSKLKPGQISQPFKSRFGWHIVQLLGRRDYDNTEQYRKSRARQALHQRKVDEALQNWVRRLRDEAYVKIRLNDD